MPNATAIAPIRTRAIAESLMLTRSTPAAWSSRAASIVRSIRIERGGSISTEMTNRRSWSARSRPVGGRVLEVSSATGLTVNVPARPGISATVGPPAGASASRAMRMARMCSGVVPQQPPTMAAPASTNPAVIAAR